LPKISDMKKQKVWLFIGRFQPWLHLGQIDALKQAMEKGVRHFLIGIGSSNKEFTRDNPFTYDERKKMIELSLKSMKWMSYQIFSIPDMDSDKAWKQYIFDTLPDFDFVITGNTRVKEIFKNSLKLRDKSPSDDKSFAIKIVWLKIRVPVKATFLRDQLALWRIEELEKALPLPLIPYFAKIKASERIMKLFHQDRRTPYLCVDVAFQDKQGNLILIERKNYPFGIALPWGFVEYGEDPKNAAVREVKEEVGAKIRIKRLIGVYGDPKRDPRAHNVSIVYEGEYISGAIKAGDDAKRVVRSKVESLKSKEALKKIKFCCDHGQIIKDFLSKS